MSYCTQADLISRFGLTELIQLTNRDDTTTQAITIIGSATTTGELIVTIGSFSVPVNVALHDTADSIATALAAALIATPNLPVSVSHANNSVFVVYNGLSLGYVAVNASALNGSSQIGGLTVTVAPTVNTTTLANVMLDAEALIDSYLNNYLPLSTLPANLVRAACVIMRFMLHTQVAPDVVKAQYDEAMRFLLLVSQGKLSLAPDQNGVIAVQVDNVVQIYNNGNVFGREDY